MKSVLKPKSIVGRAFLSVSIFWHNDFLTASFDSLFKNNEVYSFLFIQWPLNMQCHFSNCWFSESPKLLQWKGKNGGYQV